ncbi:MAG: tetratricopeptide repeat protein [Polyangiales bacterium]
MTSKIRSLAFAITAALGAPAFAQDMSAAGNEVSSIEAQTARLGSTLERAATGTGRPAVSVEDRFAEAELLYRLRDYARAAVLFTDIVENHTNSPAYPQSLFLLGDALYQAGDRYGARTRLREVMRHIAEPTFRPFVQRALGRLIEIAIRLNDYAGVDEYFRQLGQIPPSEVEGQTAYIRGKYLFLRTNPDYEGARQAFESINTQAPIYPQARYFLGAILTAQQRYPEAIEAFQRVVQLQADGADQQQVIDLAALAVGRLQVERENYDAAIEAYQQVGRSSAFFDRALFEQAWAYIKVGDAVRAERALEILSISSPDSPLVPEGRILWGNLLLRTGRFERAREVFEGVRTQFGPVYQQLRQMNDRAADPERFFQELVRSNLQVFDASSFIPQAALSWVRHEGTLDDSLQVVADLNTCRTYVREASELIDRLNAALDAPSRSHVFQDLGGARQQVWQLLNRATRAREQVALAMDAQGLGGVDFQGLVSQRRALAAQVGRLPVSDRDLRRRDQQVETEFTNLSQALQRNQQRVEGLDAMVVAIERYLADPSHVGASLDRAQLQQELERQREAVRQYRERVTNLRRMIVQGRTQIGPGDPRYVHDVEVRAQHRDLVEREATMLRAQGRMPGGADALLARVDTLERAVSEFDGRVNALVDQRSEGIRAQVREEERRVAGYRARLESLENESAQVVGNLILRQFRDIQVQFYQIVMRADLGLVDVAWEQREEHNNRARMLAEEQNREINALNDEYREVTEGARPDDARQLQGAPAPAGATPAATPAPQTPSAGSPPSNAAATPATTPGGGSQTAAPAAPQGQTP